MVILEIFFRFTICLHVILYSQVLVHILCVVPNSFLLHSQSSQKFCDFFFLSFPFIPIISFFSAYFPVFFSFESSWHETIALCLVLVSELCSISYRVEKKKQKKEKKNIFIDLRLRMRKSSARATHIHPHAFFILPQAFSLKIFLFSSTVCIASYDCV